MTTELWIGLGILVALVAVALFFFARKRSTPPTRPTTPT
ncbi:hypothetical protein EII12_02085, partial [Buchananella hordeovulneris]